MKRLLLAAAFTLLATAALAQTPPEQQLTIKLPLSSWNIVMTALGQLPYKDSSAVIGEIQTQAKPQLVAAPEDKPKR